MSFKFMYFKTRFNSDGTLGTGNICSFDAYSCFTYIHNCVTLAYILIIRIFAKLYPEKIALNLSVI
jgi:hypothetical protein